MPTSKTASINKPLPVWICPSPEPLSFKENERATAVYSQIAKMKSVPDGATGVAGLELAVALMLVERKGAFGSADNDFWGAKCQALLVRPAAEPVICAYWQRLRPFDIDPPLSLIIASKLAGRRLVYRKGPATGRSTEGDVLFEPIGIAQEWLAKLAAAAARPELLTTLPIYAFAQTVMAHPFSDGNGRFARLMVHAALGRCARLGRPELALAPAFYRRADTLGRAMGRLSRDRDWEPVNAVVLSILEDAVTLTRALHRLRRKCP